MIAFSYHQVKATAKPLSVINMI